MYPSEWGHDHGLPLWKGEQCSSVGRQFYGEGPPAPGGTLLSAPELRPHQHWCAGTDVAPVTLGKGVCARSPQLMSHKSLRRAGDA